MKLSLAAAALVLALGLSFADGRAGVSGESIATANARLGRGINLGNALEAPVEGTWGVTLKAEYFKAIRAAGFDTVRLPRAGSVCLESSRKWRPSAAQASRRA